MDQILLVNKIRTPDSSVEGYGCVAVPVAYSSAGSGLLQENCCQLSVWPVFNASTAFSIFLSSSGRFSRRTRNFSGDISSIIPDSKNKEISFFFHYKLGQIEMKRQVIDTVE